MKVKTGLLLYKYINIIYIYLRAYKKSCTYCLSHHGQSLNVISKSYGLVTTYMDSTCLEGNKYVVYVVPKCVLSTSWSASYKPHLKQGRDSLSSCLLWADLDCSKSGCKSSLLVTVFMTERWSPGRLNRTKRWYIPHTWPQKPDSHQYCIKDKSV